MTLATQCRTTGTRCMEMGRIQGLRLETSCPPWDCGSVIGVQRMGYRVSGHIPTHLCQRFHCSRLEGPISILSLGSGRAEPRSLYARYFPRYTSKSLLKTLVWTFDVDVSTERYIQSREANPAINDAQAQRFACSVAAIQADTCNPPKLTSYRRPCG